MIESTSSGALQMTTDGAGALGAFLPQLSVIEAPYLWRDAAHTGRNDSPLRYNTAELKNASFVIGVAA